MATVFATEEDLILEAKKAFLDEFIKEPNVVVSAPGRVNLIGEHIDYNDGFVLPMAIPLFTIIVGRKTDKNYSEILTLNSDIDEPKKVRIEKPIIPGLPKWANYVKGVIANYLDTALNFEAVVVSSVPTGSGLSSSAALEVATYTFLDALHGTSTIMPTDKALACQKAEHNFAGVPCGIMDQFISMLGHKNNALLIDCRSLASTLVPMNDSNIVILVTNSNVKHELNGSEYSTRQKQCQQAALLLNKLSLRDATLEDIERLKSMNADIDIIKRARHAVTEIQRTVEAAAALKEKDYFKFGQLMTESHFSLKNDFEVSCFELDVLVSAAVATEGVLGSRMTGAGFGGCTVTMVYDHAVEKTINNMRKIYNGNPIFYICTPSNGAKVIECQDILH